MPVHVWLLTDEPAAIEQVARLRAAPWITGTIVRTDARVLHKRFS
jgi:hypothetical protein